MTTTMNSAGFARTVQTLLEDTFVGDVSLVYEGEPPIPCLRVDLHEADTFLLEVQHLPDDEVEPILEDEP